MATRITNTIINFLITMLSSKPTETITFVSCSEQFCYNGTVLFNRIAETSLLRKNVLRPTKSSSWFTAFKIFYNILRCPNNKISITLHGSFLKKMSVGHVWSHILRFLQTQANKNIPQSKIDDIFQDLMIWGVERNFYLSVIKKRK